MLKRRAIPVALAAALALAGPMASRYEGKRNAAYLDPVGIPTICYGYTHGVTMQMYKTDAECSALLDEEMLWSLDTVTRLSDVPLTPAMHAAFGDFVYNTGSGNFASSTLLKKLNRGDYKGACNELSRWVYAGGSKLKGLVKRREAERQLCLSGVPE